MCKVAALDQSLVDQWRAGRDPDQLFSEASVRALLALIPDEHFMAVVTLRRGGEPRSLVFRMQRTVLAAGRRLWDEARERGGRGALAAAYPQMPISLRPFEDDPVISRDGSSRCTFAQALVQARHLARFNRCPVIYTYDESGWGTA